MTSQNTKEWIKDSLITIWDSYKIILTLASAIPLGFFFLVNDKILLDENALTIIQLITAPLVGSYLFVAIIMLFYSLAGLFYHLFNQKTDKNFKPYISNLIVGGCLVGIAFITRSLIFQQINAGQERALNEINTKYKENQTRSASVENLKKFTMLETEIDSHTKTINEIDKKLKEIATKQTMLIEQHKLSMSTIAEQDLALSKLREELKELNVKMTANN